MLVIGVLERRKSWIRDRRDERPVMALLPNNPPVMALSRNNPTETPSENRQTFPDAVEAARQRRRNVPTRACAVFGRSSGSAGAVVVVATAVVDVDYPYCQ